MDALQISGKWYISSRRAAKENGYHVDYIGQLIRTGKVKGQKVGRSWYVLADSLTDYLEKEGKEPAPKAARTKKAAAPQPARAPKPRVVEVVEPEEQQEEEEDEEAGAAPVEVEELARPEHHEEDIVREQSETPREEVEKVQEVPPVPAAASHKREHQLLTYLNDEEELPAVPPVPVVPRRDPPAGVRVMHTDVAAAKAEEGTRIPIHAAVKRFAAIRPRVGSLRAPVRAAKSLALEKQEIAVHTEGSRWIPLLLIGAVSFAITLSLSIAVSASITAL